MSRRLHHQIAAILENNGLTWRAEEGRYSLRFASAVVVLSLEAWGSQTLIRLHSNVLRSLQGTEADVLRTVNLLNGEAAFGRWVFYPAERLLTLEHELLGDHLQEAELMTALASLARVADRHDDELQSRFGGFRATDHAEGPS